MVNEQNSTRPPEVERRLALDNLFRAKVRGVIDDCNRELYQGERAEVLKAGKLKLYDVTGLKPDLAREEVITIEPERLDRYTVPLDQWVDGSVFITRVVYKGGKLDPARSLRVKKDSTDVWVVDQNGVFVKTAPHTAVVEQLAAVLDKELTPTVSLVRTIEKDDQRVIDIQAEWTGLPPERYKRVIDQKHRALAQLVSKQPILATLVAERLRDYFLSYLERGSLEDSPIFRLLDEELPNRIFYQVFAEDFSQRRFNPKWILSEHKRVQKELARVESFLKESTADFITGAILSIPGLLSIVTDTSGVGQEPELIRWAKHLPSAVAAWSIFLGMINSAYYLHETHRESYQDLHNANAILEKYLQEERLLEKPARIAT